MLLPRPSQDGILSLAAEKWVFRTWHTGTFYIRAALINHNAFLHPAVVVVDLRVEVEEK